MSDKKTPEAPKGQMNPEILKMLAAMAQKQKQPLTKRQEITEKVMKFISKAIGEGVILVDRFMNLAVNPNDPDRNDVIQTARTPILFGSYVIIGFFIFGGLWAGLAPLDSGEVAIGTLVSSSNRKILNHPQGGILKAIYVKQGEHVNEGDPIVALDDVAFKAQYETFLNQYRTLLMNQARLIAERDGDEEIKMPEELLAQKDDLEVKKIRDTQDNLFVSRRETIKGAISSREQQILQSRKQIEGEEANKISLTKNYVSTKDRLKAAKELFKKGFVSKTALMEIEVREADLESRVTNCDINIARINQDISRLEIEILNVKSDSLTKVLSELKDVQTQLPDVYGRYLQSKDAFDRAIITAPVDGIVNVLKFHTIGMQIPAQQPIAEVSPEKDFLVVEVKIPTKNIASVHVGLKTKIRFSAFKSRTTPTFNGTLVALSPDILTDERGGAMGGDPTYYAGRVEIDMDEFNEVAKARNLELHPGMQVEVQIITGTRTLLRYMLDPITDTAFKSLGEK
jgi:HlyD family type I secretion membrane fusion protein